MLDSSLGLIELKRLVLNYCAGTYKYRVWISQFSKPGKDNVVPDASSRVILEFASNHTRRTTTSEQPIATLTPVLELVVEPQAPYDSKDDVAVSYDSLATLDDVHHGAASIDHVASITPTDFPDRDGIVTAQRTDPSLASIITALESTAPSN
jgi:hypothetical protein